MQRLEFPRLLQTVSLLRTNLPAANFKRCKRVHVSSHVLVHVSGAHCHVLRPLRVVVLSCTLQYRWCWWWRTRLPLQETRETGVRSPGREDPLQEGQPSPVFLPGESHDLGVHGVSKSQTWLKRLSTHSTQSICHSLYFLPFIPLPLFWAQDVRKSVLKLVM